MTDTSNTSTNGMYVGLVGLTPSRTAPQLQTLTNIESSISNAVNVFENGIQDTISKMSANVKVPMSTDPIPPTNHVNLIDGIADITDYINGEVKKHKELVVHIESMRDKLTNFSDDLKNYHLDEKLSAAKDFVVKEEKAFMTLTIAQKIELLIVGVAAIGIIIAAIKFL